VVQWDLVDLWVQVGQWGLEARWVLAVP